MAWLEVNAVGPNERCTLWRASAILDILRAQRVKSVFCVTGDWARANPSLIAGMVQG